MVAGGAGADRRQTGSGKRYEKIVVLLNMFVILIVVMISQINTYEGRPPQKTVYLFLHVYAFKVTFKVLSV